MSKYDALSTYLSGAGSSPLRMSFAQVEAVLGFKLPPSSRKHSAWWANDRTHRQSQAWLSVGWETSDVDRLAKKVTFQRAGSD